MKKFNGLVESFKYHFNVQKKYAFARFESFASHLKLFVQSAEHISLFFIMLMALGCSPLFKTTVERTTPPRFDADKKTSSPKAWPMGYREDVQNLVLFLWPLEIEPQDLPLITQVIRNGRTISELRLEYDKTKVALSQKWDELKCACVLYGECIATSEPYGTHTLLLKSTFQMENLDETQCAALEEELFANEGKIAIIATELEVMRTSLITSGGMWFDIDRENLPQFDIKTLTLKLPTLKSFGGEFTLPALLGMAITMTPLYEGYVMTLQFEPNKSSSEFAHTRRYGFAELNATRTASTMTFQGDIEISLNNQRRRGILFFQIEKE